jgi:hypothetical protein
VAGLRIIKKSQRFKDIIVHDANDVAISGDIPSSFPDIIEAIEAGGEKLFKDLDGVHRFHLYRVSTDCYDD